MESIRVIIVDDHFLIRLGLKNVLSGSKNDTKIEVVAEADCASELYQLLDSGVKADLLLLDIMLPDESGIEIAKNIKTNYPDLKILFISAETTEETITEILKLETGGFVSKNSTEDELVRAVDCVAFEGTYYGKDIATLIHNIKLSKTESNNVQFTPSELKILELSAKGLYAKEISHILNISHKTVGVHKSNICKKLNITNSIDLVKYCIKMGFIKL